MYPAVWIFKLGPIRVSAKDGEDRYPPHRVHVQRGPFSVVFLCRFRRMI